MFTARDFWHRPIALRNRSAAQLRVEDLEARLVLSLPVPDHVVIVIEENLSYSEIIGSSEAPYINSLASSGAVFTRSYAIEHPSEPNYLDLFSGSNQGTDSGWNPCPVGPFHTRNLGGELIAARLSFAGYFDGMPSVGYMGCFGGSWYTRNDNPLTDFSDVPSNVNKPFAGYFPTNFTTLPRVSWVIPSLIHDMHDGTISQGDTWLRSNLQAYINWSYQHNSLFILTFDEDDFGGDNQIPTIFVGPMVQRGQYSETINHYSVLRTLEDMYGLPYAGHSADVNPITDVWVGGPTHFTVTTSAANPDVAGTPFTVTVTAQDANGNTATDYRGTVHFTSSDPQALLPADYTFTAADNGTHTFTATLRTAGTRTITATDAASSSITGSTTVTVSPAAAAMFLVAGFPSPTTAGSPGSFTVTAKDSYGNTATGYTGTVRFSSSDPQAVLPANYTFLGSDGGSKTFTATLKTAGTRSLTATDSANGSITGTQAGIVVNAAAASTLVVSGYPSPTTAGTPGTFTVAAKDPYGNTATSYTGTIHFTSSDRQAGLPADYTFTSGDNGVHGFTATLKTAGTQSLTATDTRTGSITGTQAGIVVNPGAASTLAVAGFPSPTRAGTAGTVTVTAQDAYGNMATGYTGTIHFTSSDSQAVLPPDYAFTSADNGTHAFSATLLTAGTRSLTATDTSSGTIAGTQSGIVITPAPASQVAVSTPPGSTAGQTFSLTVTALDPYGNTDPDYQGTIRLTSSDPAAALPPNYTFTAADAGVHTFSGVILYTAGSQTVTATDTVSGITGSATVPVTAAPAAFFYLDAPASSTPGTPFTLTVYAFDPYWNLDTNYGGPVTFSSSDPAAVLPPDYAFQPSDGGVASFVVILNTRGDQTVTATDTASGITGNATVTVTAGPLAGHGTRRGIPEVAVALGAGDVALAPTAPRAPAGTGDDPSRLKSARAERFFSGTAGDGGALVNPFQSVPNGMALPNELALSFSGLYGAGVGNQEVGRFPLDPLSVDRLFAD
jgi:hypothetical protein